VRIARLNSGERFDDPTVSDPFQREVSVHPDCEGGSHGSSSGATATAVAT
jgi:hypothetical protein